MTINYHNAAIGILIVASTAFAKERDLTKAPPKKNLAINGHPNLPTNAVHLHDQQDCTNVEGWHDSFGPQFDCDYYANGFNCLLFGWTFENDGYTANEACCACGGGNIETDGGDTCEDVSGWYDSDGPEFDCDWYEETHAFYGLQPSCNSVDGSKYNMCLDLVSLSGSYEPWMEAYAKARDRWQSVVVGNLKSIDSSQLESTSEITCTEYPSNIDDLYICAREERIDGPSGILGAAGWVYARESGEHNPRTGEEYIVALTGVMYFDEADIGMLVDSGEFDEVVFHEMGHVMGLGSLWIDNGLHYDGSDEYASGTYAEAEWNAIGCSGPLPVETDGGEGTAGGHWDETCLRHEVMSGYLSGSSQPLSRITIGSYQDMGYQVDYNQADSFGTNDLGTCGSYCPEARRQLRKKKKNATKKKKVVLDDDSMNAVMRFAKMELTKIHQEVEAGLKAHKDDGLRIAEDMDVLYRDGTGSIHVVKVTWKDVQNLRI